MSERAPLTFALFPDVPAFSLTSQDVADGARLSEAQVADSMGYSGANLSPQLAWAGFPAETKSFAVTIHDPDAPTGSGFWHWCVVNIPASVTALASGAGRADGSLLPVGAVQLRNDSGARGYLGSAPPPGDEPHRYVTTVHAVDVDQLDVGPDDAPAIAGFNLRFHGIARAQVVPVYAS
jgi:Raf kinase inhibitor-like YbhB/YbcL family protein